MDPWDSDAAERRGVSGFGIAAFSRFLISSGDVTKDEVTWKISINVLLRQNVCAVFAAIAY